ncbi:peptidylprolyl isomerase [uncultured Paracoccus sp.]|uniref:peptidylprolyl isomerase n=1 Tax=uncultured Paracoccus sp. TaxID=189685 RepID=UPI0025F9EA09|nr:peptidylprolyl isomerase [uncultured Paracoccus sp.]
MFRPILAIALLAAGPVLAQDADTVVATVNDEPITLGQMLAMKEGLAQDATSNMPDEALWNLMLDQMVRQTAVGQLREGNMTARDKAALEIDRRAYLAGAALEEIALSDPSEDELRGVYDRIFGGDTEPALEYQAAHILVETEDEARTIADEIAGGADFGEMAEQNSTDNSAANKGDLGWFQPQQMVEPFAQAVVALEPGQVSDPIQTQFGWHVIRLNETRQVEAPDFDEVREELAVQVRRERVEALIQQAVDEATVEQTEGLDPALLNNTDLLEQ